MKAFSWYKHSNTLFFLIPGLLTLGMLIIIPEIRERNNKPEKILIKFETLLREHENHIHKEIEYFSEKFIHDSTLRFPEMRYSRKQKPDPVEMTFLAYRGDSLVYWSDNLAPFYASPHPFDTATPVVIRLANGWYEMMVFRRGLYQFVGLCLLKKEFLFQNQYLKNGYCGTIAIPPEVTISLDKGTYNAYSIQGKFLCSLSFPATLTSPYKQGWMIIFIILTYLFFIAFIYRFYYQVQQVVRNTRWIFVLLVADMVILRGIQFILHWPQAIYQSALFGPVLYSSSWFLPSLGDFLINSILFLALAYIFYRRWPRTIPGSYHKKWLQGTGLSIKFFISLILLVLVMSGIHSLVIHSTLPMNLENISRLTWETIPAFLSIGFLAVAWILITLRLTGTVFQIQDGRQEIDGKRPYIWLFIAIVLVAACATVVLNRANADQEKEQRELLAIRLATRKNPVTELLLQQNILRMNLDTNLVRILATPPGVLDLEEQEDSLADYMLHTYFRDYWNNFNVQVTICREMKTLRIQPLGFLMGCNEYFREVISSFGKETVQPGIYFLDYGYGNENYLAHISLKGIPEEIYIELSSRSTYQNLGYPELLVDRSTYDFPDLTGYSYAFFKQNELVHRVGDYAYGFALDRYMDTLSGYPLEGRDQIDHFIYRIGETDTLIISKRNPTWLQTISPFSYLVIFILLLTFIGFTLLNYQEIRGKIIQSLRNRLQLTMLGMIIASFIITGIFMMADLIWLNSQKNKENLLERTLSILIEVEHKFDHLQDLRQAGREEVESMLIKFSNVFFSDINLYDPSGVLIASSRSRIFEEGLIADRINRQALNKLEENKTSMFVQIEHIGELNYLSSYVPFNNSRNVLLGYLNLPYFSREEDLKKEIATFLVAFINIYVLIILLGALVTYLISNYITSPLKLLAQRIGKIRFDKTDEKLIWKREDEIGKLVDEYNRMLDELAVSAEKLAISERELAWREMAKQVAHEIKNPLTPMKLSVQYLLKAWEDKAEDWDQRLQRFAEALITQIDTLSAIASEFSYFAKMPEPVNETLDLDEMVKTSLTMYKDVSSIRFEFHREADRKGVYADRKQLLRVFCNLINNAIEAIDKRENGVIQFQTSTEGAFHTVRITDNGKGIRAEEAEKIFQPNFTTRSGGAGLGLAIVRGIVLSIGGEISFISQPGEYTTFTIRFPVTPFPESAP